PARHFDLDTAGDLILVGRDGGLEIVRGAGIIAAIESLLRALVIEPGPVGDRFGGRRRRGAGAPGGAPNRHLAKAVRPRLWGNADADAAPAPAVGVDERTAAPGRRAAGRD